MDPQTHAYGLRGFVIRVQLPATGAGLLGSAAGRAVNREQVVAEARDFRDSFAFGLRITIFQPFLSSRLSSVRERRRASRAPSASALQTGWKRPGRELSWRRDTLLPTLTRDPARLPAGHAGAALRGERGSREGPSHPAGEMEGEVRASGGGDSLCILSLCPLSPPPPAEASPLGSCRTRRIRDGGDGGIGMAVSARRCKVEHRLE